MSLRGFRGDQTFLPATLLLSGIGLILMVSLRDPVRDNLLFVDFAQGVAGGLPAARRPQRSRLRAPVRQAQLCAAAGERRAFRAAGALRPRSRDERRQGESVRFPAGRDHPAAARILPRRLLRLALGRAAARARNAARACQTDQPLRHSAGRVYASRCWPAWRFRWSSSSCKRTWGRRWYSPAFSCCCTASRAAARSCPRSGWRWSRSVSSPATRSGFRIRSASAFRCGSRRGTTWCTAAISSRTRCGRSRPAASPGAGIGLGEPQLVPAAHTDLILAALGEEWGFLGVAAVFALYALIVYRAHPRRPARPHRLRILPRRRTCRRHRAADPADRRRRARRLPALRRGDPVPQLRPLVDAGELRRDRDPALDFGARRCRRTACRALPRACAPGRSACSRSAEHWLPRRRLTFRSSASGPIMGEGALVVQADGARRYQYNPRLTEIMRDIPKGTIYDRNGLPLATSDWALLEKHRARVQAARHRYRHAPAGRTDLRHYPFGGLMFDLLGDLRTRTRWAATQHVLRRTRFRAAPARIRRAADAGRSEEPLDRQNGPRREVRLPRAVAAAAASQ